MKVLALVHKYPPVHNAGAEVMLHAILVDLARRGHTCAVTYPKAKLGELDGIPIAPTPAQDHDVIKAAQAADILITHLDVTPRAMRIAKAAHRPLVHIVHNDGQLPHHRVTEDAAALVVWNSQWIAERYATWRGPSTILRPPVTVADYELADLPPKGTPPPFGIDRRGARLAGDIALINLTQAKGAGIFYAMAEAMPERTFLGVRGAYGTQVEPRNLRRPGRLRNVELLAHVPAASMREAVYARTRILLVPSSYESWGRVAIEASAASVPAIAHPTPGLLESLGPDGLFADHAKPGEWRRIIARLDDKVFYRERVELGLERARYLEALTNADLERFALRLEEVASAYARPDQRSERTPMAILSSSRTGGPQCPVCGAQNCACGNSGITIRPPSRRGLPVAVYRTASGHFRLNEDDARRRGLLPDGPELPLAARRLLAQARVPIDAHADVYAQANDDARAEYLQGLAAHRPAALAERAEDLLDTLATAQPAEKTEGLEDLVNADSPAGTRVGEVLSWAGEDRQRIEEALTAERAAAKPRPTLIAELERRLEETATP